MTGQNSQLILYAIRIEIARIFYFTIMRAFKGKIKEGYLADFIVLSDDIFSITEEEILSVKVEKTYLGGEPVYTR